MKLTKQRLKEIIKEEIIKEGSSGPNMDAAGYIANAQRTKSPAAFNDLLSIATGRASTDLKSIMAPEQARIIIIDAAKILKISELEAVAQAIMAEITDSL